MPGIPITDADGTLLGLAISGGHAGPQSMVSILDAGAIRKSLADWLRTSPPPVGVQLTSAPEPSTPTQAN